MDRQVKLWFFQRLLSFWIKEKGADKCALMQDSVSEKFSGIDENGYIWWDALKHDVENPFLIMSKTAWNHYLESMLEQLVQLVPHLYIKLESEYEQLEHELYMVLEKKAISPTEMLNMQEMKIRQKMYFYESAGSWRDIYAFPWVFQMKPYNGKLWFRFIE